MKVLQVDLTHDKRRQCLKGTWGAEDTRGVAQRDVTKTSTAWETPRGVNWKSRCVPECDNEEATPRATRAGRHKGVSRKACPKGEWKKSEG